MCIVFTRNQPAKNLRSGNVAPDNRFVRLYSEGCSDQAPAELFGRRRVGIGRNPSGSQGLFQGTGRDLPRDSPSNQAHFIWSSEHARDLIFGAELLDFRIFLADKNREDLVLGKKKPDNCKGLASHADLQRTLNKTTVFEFGILEIFLC